MRKSFGGRSARRVPRKIGGDSDDEPDTKRHEQEESSNNNASEQVVVRPLSKVKPHRKGPSRLSTSLKSSQIDSTYSTEDDDPLLSGPISRAHLKPLHRNLRPSTSSESLPFRATQLENRPSYSKDALSELKSATPSKPRSPPEDGDANEKGVDVALKFGLQLGEAAGVSMIPSESEIREKKARRARLAKEEDFISLDAKSEGDWEDENRRDPNDSDEFVDKRAAHGQSSQIGTSSRLVQEDEDIAEGFEEYVEDEKISLGRKAEAESRRKRRTEMANMIAEAERGDDSDESIDSAEAERNAAYEATQTRAGIYGRETRPLRSGIKGPPKIPKVPELSAILEKLTLQLRDLEDTKAKNSKRLEDIRAEKSEIASREELIQKQLSEAGERYKKLSVEAGISGGASTPVSGENGQRLIVQRGLESLTATPMSSTSGLDYFEQME